MKILFTSDPEVLVPPVGYGGIQRILADLIAALEKQGHQVALVAAPGSTLNCTKLYFWPGLQSQNLVDSIRNITFFNAVLSEWQPDLIHSFARALYLLPALLRQVPSIMSYQRRPGRRAVRIASTLGRTNFRFTACSDFIRRIGEQAAGRWSTIHNFVDPGRYVPAYEVDSTAPLVFLSRLDRIKGAHTAIKIAQSSGRKLIIAGNVPETPEGREYFSKEVEPFIDGKGIAYIGEVNDQQKNKLLAEALALLLPIEWDEPFGIVYVESLACGTPVITAPRGAAPEIITSGSTGFLCGSFPEYLEAVKKVGQINRQTCRSQMEQQFALNAKLQEYEQLYRELVPC